MVEVIEDVRLIDGRCGRENCDGDDSVYSKSYSSAHPASRRFPCRLEGTGRLRYERSQKAAGTVVVNEPYALWSA